MESEQARDFTFEEIDGKIAIKKYDGEASDVAIPDMIDGKPVFSIVGKAFYGAQLTSVAIPSTVEAIGSWAFRKNLFESVTLPASVKTIGLKAFDDHVQVTRL